MAVDKGPTASLLTPRVFRTGMSTSGSAKTPTVNATGLASAIYLISRVHTVVKCTTRILSRTSSLATFGNP